MDTNKRRGGYLATAEGVKKLKEAKRIKKYTYQQIADAARETEDKVKRLFNPQWGDGKYKVGEEAVEAICGVLDVKPEEIVSDWYPLKISSETEEVATSTQVKQNDPAYYEALKKIEQAARDEAEQLDLSNMKLTEIPTEIGCLTNLKKLYLGYNHIRVFTKEIGRLTELRLLSLGSNRLIDLPDEIGNLTKLTHLHLSRNSLKNLPTGIGELTSVRHFYVSSNNLKSLPNEIENLYHIEVLDLGNNRQNFRTLNSSIGKLFNLKILYLSSNYLKDLPDSICQLKNLEYLYICSNLLKNLPTEFNKLENLKVLDLRSNGLEHFPLKKCNLKNLQELLLGKVDVDKIPSLEKRSSNDMSITECNNFIDKIPKEIYKLKNLKVFDLSNNSLHSLPQEIQRLTKLKIINIKDNFLPIPPEISEKYDDSKIILKYYLSITNNYKKPIYEAKMLLVGQGNVGKTCLKERLVRDKYDPIRNKTDGIDIENWKIRVDDKELQVNIWDFGGQEIMHSTHQFFLTKRSLYLLVLDTTQSEEENRIEYWLKIIQSFGKDAPVIIVGNKADQHRLDIDRSGLQKKYPQIKAFYEVSCETSKGISELAEFVRQEINQLKHIDDPLPLPWFNIKEQLEKLALDKDYIPYEQYEFLCEQEGVEIEDNQRILIRLLNDLGIVLNFQDDPRLEDTHVLNPEWVTNGVYKILNDRNLIIEDRGILTIQTLKRILDKKRYPPRKHLFIIAMMRKFELCFDIESDKQFLIPDILPKEETYTGEWDNTLAFEYHYPVLPGSIISRFIVRMNHYIHQTTYWRSGVVLEHEGNLALVKADQEDKIIKIRVNGKANTRRNLLTAIRSQFDYIHKTIPGIVPIAKVPLIEHPEIILDYQDLLDLESMGEKDVIVPKLKQRIPLRQLLDGIEEPQNRGNKRFRNKDNL